MRYRHGILSVRIVYRCIQAAAVIVSAGLLSVGNVYAAAAGAGGDADVTVGAEIDVDMAVGAEIDVDMAAGAETGTGAAGSAQEDSRDGQKDLLRITRNLETGQNQPVTAPPETYWDKEGGEYRLDHWEVVKIPGHPVQRHLEKQVVYAGVEGAEGLPESIAVEEEVSGMPAEGSLYIRQSRKLKEEWQDGFSAPVTFHSYGADEYHAGGLVIQGEDILGTSVAMGGELLNVMGLSPSEYRILSMEWMGEPYEDPEGNLCRQALASGQKLLRDYEITYEGEISFMEPETYELEMTYRPVALQEERAQGAVEETIMKEAPKEVLETEKGSLWYWVRSGFVITVGAGLIGIAVGLVALLILWYRQNRREHRRIYLPQIKG